MQAENISLVHYITFYVVHWETTLYDYVKAYISLPEEVFDYDILHYLNLGWLQIFPYHQLYAERKGQMTFAGYRFLHTITVSTIYRKKGPYDLCTGLLIYWYGFMPWSCKTLSCLQLTAFSDRCSKPASHRASRKWLAGALLSCLPQVIKTNIRGQGMKWQRMKCTMVQDASAFLIENMAWKLLCNY